MLLTLLTLAVLSDVSVEVTNDVLGVTVYTVSPGFRPGPKLPGEVLRTVPPMLQVDRVDPAKIGFSSGLKSGDMILGVTSYNVFKPQDIHYPPITILAFEKFPYTVVSGNTVHSILVYRPSLDSTAQLRVLFSGEPEPWPSGALGVVVADVSLMGIPEDRSGKASWVEVLRVHPYSLADRLGIRLRDVVLSMTLVGDDPAGLEIPVSLPINSVTKLTEALNFIRSQPTLNVVIVNLRRGDKEINVKIPAAKLR